MDSPSTELSKTLNEISEEMFVEQMEKEFPETTSAFKQIQKEQYLLFLHKHHDYGASNIAVGTECRSPEEIKMSITGIWFRCRDKVERLKNLLFLRKETQNESVIDSWKDITNYGIIAQIVEQGKWGK